jgi:hypothetical protein
MLEIQVNNGDPAVLDTTNATPLEMEVLNRRAERNALLQESDKFIVADYPTSKLEDWKTYRQSLRDMSFSDPDNLTWPTKPE